MGVGTGKGVSPSPHEDRRWEAVYGSANNQVVRALHFRNGSHFHVKPRMKPEEGASWAFYMKVGGEQHRPPSFGMPVAPGHRVVSWENP